MLSLHTHLTKETIQSNPKLQKIECEKIRCITSDLVEEKIYSHTELRLLPYPEIYLEEKYPAPSIADILNNAEKLFGDEKIMKPSDAILSFSVGEKYLIIQDEILKLCQQDKPLSEIESYIVNNLK